MDEAERIVRAQAGSVEAFTDLVRGYQHRIRGYVAGLVGDRPEVVDDVAQETFLAAFRSLKTYDAARTPLGAWLAGIARHRALTFLRDEQRRRHREQDRLDTVLAEGRIAAAEALTEPRLTLLGPCLEALPDPSRNLFRARYVDECSIDDLARRSGKAVTAVRMALSRVRAALRRCIERRGATA